MGRPICGRTGGHRGTDRPGRACRGLRRRRDRRHANAGEPGPFHDLVRGARPLGTRMNARGNQTRGDPMARVPVLQSPEELTGEARAIAEKIVVTCKSLEGPFSVWMHAPEWAERVAHLGTLVRWEGTLELRLRTLAALVVGRHFQAQYVWGIQGVIGAERNVPRSTIDAIRDDRSDGIPPEDLQIIDFTRQLLRGNRVDEPLARSVMARLVADQFVQLTTCIGYYAMLAMTVNGVELEPDPKHEALKI